MNIHVPHPPTNNWDNNRRSTNIIKATLANLARIGQSCSLILDGSFLTRQVVYAFSTLPSGGQQAMNLSILHDDRSKIRYSESNFIHHKWINILYAIG